MKLNNVSITQENNQIRIIVTRTDNDLEEATRVTDMVYDHLKQSLNLIERIENVREYKKL